jgi:hypothetical protein
MRLSEQYAQVDIQDWTQEQTLGRLKTSRAPDSGQQKINAERLIDSFFALSQLREVGLGFKVGPRRSRSA